MSTVAERARAAAMPVEGKKDSLSQRQDGHWKIAFTVAPGDMPQAIAMAPMGTRYMLAIVQIGDDEEPIPPAQQASPPRPKNDRAQERAREVYANSDPDKKAITRAALLCQDAEFQLWIGAKFPHTAVPRDLIEGARDQEGAEEKVAAFLLRKCIGINSRSQIGTEQAAYTAFIRLESDYRESTGQAAERRG